MKLLIPPTTPENMNTAALLFLFLFLYLIVILCKNFIAKKSKNLTNWPIFGMIPDVLLNVWRVHDFATDVLEENGGTLVFKGPSFAHMDMLITSDPANVHYILTKNFHNFGKGPDFKKIFNLLGDGIFSAESESWENQRKVSKILMANTSFQQFSARTIWSKVETGLIPILNSAAETDVIIDLQDLFKRLAFDSTCLIVLGHDPGSLSKELPYLPHEKAFTDAEEIAFYRHVVPDVITRLQKWLQIGMEKKINEAADAITLYMLQCTSRSEEKVEQVDNEQDILSCYRRALADTNDAMNIPQELWKDLCVNLVFAGKGTISAALAWFFYLLLTNPEQEKKVKEEIAAHTHVGTRTWSFSNVEEMKKLVYLHGALCETLRLFPPVPLQHKAPIQDDVLPSGHRIKANTKTILSFYSMGRMKSIWGEDVMAFKPERWISDTGRTIVVPAFKFPAFNAGPRTCIGKDMSFVQLKIVAAAVISRFNIRLMGGYSDVPRPCKSTTSHMEHGLKVKVSN